MFLDHPDLTGRDLIQAIGIDGLEHAQAVRGYLKRCAIVYERVASSIYSRRMHESFGMSGAIRVSPLHCHSRADIDRFLAVTRQIAAVSIHCWPWRGHPCQQTLAGPKSLRNRVWLRT